MKPRIIPIVGRKDYKARGLDYPFQTRTAVPPLTIPAPIKPPINAWEELLGSPNHQVIRFQIIAPSKAERIRIFSTILRVDDSCPDGLGDRGRR